MTRGGPAVGGPLPTLTTANPRSVSWPAMVCASPTFVVPLRTVTLTDFAAAGDGEGEGVWQVTTACVLAGLPPWPCQARQPNQPTAATAARTSTATAYGVFRRRPRRGGARSPLPRIVTGGDDTVRGQPPQEGFRGFRSVPRRAGLCQAPRRLHGQPGVSGGEGLRGA